METKKMRFNDLTSCKLMCRSPTQCSIISPISDKLGESTTSASDCQSYVQGACGIHSPFSKLNITSHKRGRRKLRTCAESLVYIASTWCNLVCFSMSGETHIINRGAIVSGVHEERTNKEISKFKNIPMNMHEEAQEGLYWFYRHG